jgi:hypothetical protein
MLWVVVCVRRLVLADQWRGAEDLVLWHGGAAKALWFVRGVVSVVGLVGLAKSPIAWSLQLYHGKAQAHSHVCAL